MKRRPTEDDKSVLQDRDKVKKTYLTHSISCCTCRYIKYINNDCRIVQRGYLEPATSKIRGT